jgi:hypothetical protein
MAIGVEGPAGSLYSTEFLWTIKFVSQDVQRNACECKLSVIAETIENAVKLAKTVLVCEPPLRDLNGIEIVEIKRTEKVFIE